MKRNLSAFTSVFAPRARIYSHLPIGACDKQAASPVLRALILKLLVASANCNGAFYVVRLRPRTAGRVGEIVYHKVTIERYTHNAAID